MCQSVPLYASQSLSLSICMSARVSLCLPTSPPSLSVRLSLSLSLILCLRFCSLLFFISKWSDAVITCKFTHIQILKMKKWKTSITKIGSRYMRDEYENYNTVRYHLKEFVYLTFSVPLSLSPSISLTEHSGNAIYTNSSFWSDVILTFLASAIAHVHDFICWYA